MPLGEYVPDHCVHGDPACACLDKTDLTVHFKGENGWQQVSGITGFDISGGSSAGTLTGGTFGPLTGTTSFPTYPATSAPGAFGPNTLGFPTPNPTPFLACGEVGHRISDKTTIVADDEGTLVGICETCYQTVYFPGGTKAFDFERAGVILGRAIGIDADDDESVGEMFTELALLETEIDNQVRRFEAAKDLLALARGVVKKRALRDAATGVDTI